jgi:phosphoglucosamine mutase
MTRKYFGTDGIRGESNTAPMDAQTTLRVGMAAGAHFTKNHDRRHRVVIGKDTRLSGYMIEPALTSGFISMGMDVILVGPIPTPGISMLTRSLRADLGVMISASHNAYHDNGIKFFDATGSKLSDEEEANIESLMDSDLTAKLATPENLGKASRLDDAPGRYIEHIKATFPRGKRLDGIKVVLDCANGAAYKLAPTILWELGAEVHAIGNTPNGYNINENCGSTYPKLLCETVLEQGAHIGIALDGDADRLIVCDELGNVIDGDQVMAAIATYFHEKNILKGDGVVATVMSNLGFEKYLETLDLKLHRSAVGDRHVVEKMRTGDYNLGGEQSGHIILRDHNITGDGTLAALQVLALLVEKKDKASNLLNVFTPYPQLLKNIRFDKNQQDPLENDTVKAAISKGESEMAETGRILIRKSGTEPLIRVMTEGSDADLTEKVANDIVNAIKALG